MMCTTWKDLHYTEMTRINHQLEVAMDQLSIAGFHTVGAWIRVRVLWD